MNNNPNYFFRKKNQFFFNVILLISVVFLLSHYFINNEKIAYVDSAKILNDFQGSAEAKKEFQSKSKVWQSNIDTLTSEIKQAMKNYEKSLASMSAKEQDLYKQVIQNKQQKLEDYQKSIRENARQEDAKLTQSVVSKINAFLQKYGKSHNFKLILIANQSGTIAYAREGLDITEDVLKELNSEYLPGK